MKLQEVVWTIFGDGAAVDGKERGPEDAGREAGPPAESQAMASAKIMRLEQGRPHLETRRPGPAFVPNVPASLSLLKLLPH